MPVSIMRIFLLGAIVSLTAACANTGNANHPIPTRSVLAGSQPGTVLVVVLPGRWDNAEVMADAGVAGAIQAAWPEADVLLTSATLAYYMDGQLPQRLMDEVFEPARRSGYEQIWLVGASMGGMGTLLFEQEFPGQAEGLVLLAPYLGRGRVLNEIRRAGGIAAWTPGPEPATRDRSNFDRELWRHLQGWMDQPDIASRVWLAYGENDRLRQAAALFAPLVPAAQILERPGGHTWSVWVPAAREVFEQALGDGSPVASSTGSAEPASP